jgi:hypothetical protein
VVMLDFGASQGARARSASLNLSVRETRLVR